MPYAYTITRRSSYSHLVFPTLASAVKTLREEGCAAYYALELNPIMGHHEDGTETSADLTPFTEQVVPDPQVVLTLRAKVEELVAESQKDYNAALAALAPGERLHRYSGQHWLCEIGVEAIMEKELAKLVVQWREGAA